MADVKAYADQLRKLLPPGVALSTGPVLFRLLEALAAPIAAVDIRARDLLREVDPRSTIEMLDDWERVAGLPSDCITEPQTIAERQDALHSSVRARGGQSPAYFVNVAARLGYSITITEFRPFRVGQSTVGDRLTNGPWQHTWRVNAPETTVRAFRVGRSVVGDRLRSWGNDALECEIGALKPAHTIALFAYGALE